jgi:hypothetical protein
MSEAVTTSDRSPRDERVPRGGSRVPPGGSTDRAAERRLVRTIVCGYTRDELPASWIQVFRRFERAVARAGLRIRVRLMPLEELPESFDVLVVAPRLEQRARELATGAAGGARLLVMTREQAADAVADLLRELEEGRTIYAEPADPNEPLLITRRGGDVV